MDPLFRVELITATPNPQQCIYAAMHQDYSEGFVYDERDKWPDETRAGEIAVKRLLSGERGHYGCYSADTQVLTSRGWVFWPHVTENDLLAAVNIHSQSIRFEKPTSLQCVNFDDNDFMYHLDTQRLSALVTLDHRMVKSTRKCDQSWTDWSFSEASSIYGKSVRYMLSGILNDAERRVPDDCPVNTNLAALFKLAGFFYGDGCRSSNKNPRCLRFKLKRRRKINYLKNIGFDVEDKKDNRFTVRHQSASHWVSKHFSTEDGKIIPPFVMTLPCDLFQAFIDGLKNSDGTLKHFTWAVDSVEKKSLDILQAAFHLNGVAASISLNNPNVGPGHENHRPCWRLHVSSREPYARSECGIKGRTRGNESLVKYQGKVYCASVSTGALLVRRMDKPMVCGNCLEHAQITLNAGWFPHSVMQQARTHRVGLSFDVQSFRYTGNRIVRVANGEISPEEVFYLRQPGFYRDRSGKKYEYTSMQRSKDMELVKQLAANYKLHIDDGMAEEHARSIIPFDTRQHFVVSFSLRALLHFLDLRAKKDAQDEIRCLCELMLPHLHQWVPQIAEWYVQNRLGKARLAP